MIGQGITSTMFFAILPEIGLVVLSVVLLVMDLVWREKGSGKLGWLTVGGIGVIVVASILFSQPGSEPVLLWGGLLRLDQAGFVFRLLFLTGAGLTALFATENDALSQRGEFYILMLISTLGMSLMAAASDLIMLYLAIETTTIPLYVLAGFLTKDTKSVEAGIKYMLFGALTSAVLLYGFSFLYGFSGTTQIYEIGQKLQAGNVSVFLTITVLTLILVGFGFKISAVPFHFWAPDVYEGAPTPVAGFLSTASKAAGFVVLMRVLLSVFPNQAGEWTILVALLASASMIVGNFVALAQKNIKRLLAYSSIAQAGYILIGVAAGSQLGTLGAVYYLMAYLVTNMAAFGIVTMVSRTIGSDDISAYAGLSRRSPRLALALLVALLSLGGIPPFAGFFGKLLVFGAAVQANMVWLAILGVLNSIVALYYYLNILKVVYLYHSEDENRPIVINRYWIFGLSICVFGILLLGVWFGPWYAWSSSAAISLIAH
jgi:NADH-quinone oxidoreductase subunit N